MTEPPHRRAKAPPEGPRDDSSQSCRPTAPAQSLGSLTRDDNELIYGLLSQMSTKGTTVGDRFGYLKEWSPAVASYATARKTGDAKRLAPSRPGFNRAIATPRRKLRLQRPPDKIAEATWDSRRPPAPHGGGSLARPVGRPGHPTPPKVAGDATVSSLLRKFLLHALSYTSKICLEDLDD